MHVSRTQQMLSIVFAVIAGLVIASATQIVMGGYLLGIPLAVIVVVVWTLLFRPPSIIKGASIGLVAVAAFLLGSFAALNHIDCGSNCVSDVTDMDKTICLIMGIFTAMAMIIPTLWSAFRRD